VGSAGGTPSSSPDRRAARPTQPFTIEEGLTKLADGTAGMMARKLLTMQKQRETTPETSSEKSRNPADVSAVLADPVWNDTTASVGVHLDITEAPSGWGEDVSIRQAQSNESLWDVGEEGERETPDAKGDDTCWDDESTGAGIIEAAEVQSLQSWELELITTLTPADIPHRWEHFKKLVLLLVLTSVADRDVLWQKPVWLSHEKCVHNHLNSVQVFQSVQ
jgi:hypothetical protein